MTPADPTPERHVLGALITGALGPADVDGLADDFRYEAHRSLFAVLLSAAETRGRGISTGVIVAVCDMMAAPGPLGANVRALAGMGAAWADDSGRFRRWTGYVPWLAREAPRRREAFDAVNELRGREARAWDLERDKEAVRSAVVEVAQTAALAYLRVVEHAGGLPYVAAYEGDGEALRRRYEVRPVELAAIPTAAQVMGWLGGGP